MNYKYLLSITTAFTLVMSVAVAQQNGERNQSQSGLTTQNQNLMGELGLDAVFDPRNSKIQHYKIGDFVFNPSITVSEYFDDNIFYTRENPDEDFITVIAPRLSLQSDWSHHALNFQSGAAIARYRTHDKEDYEDYYLGFDGHYDLAPNSRLFGGLQYNALSEGRESPEDVNGLRPTEYDMVDLFLGGQHQFNQYGVKAGFTMQDFDFDDSPTSTGTINNDDRDRSEYELGARITRPWQNFRAFVQGVIGKRDYDDSTDDTGLNRDSDGYGLAVGGLFNPYRNLNIEVLAGGLHQNYDDPKLSNITALDYGAILSWHLSPATKFDFMLDRRVRETTLAGSSGYLSTLSEINLHHDFTQKLNMNLGASLTENDYEGIERTDQLLGFHVDNLYYFTPKIYGGLGYEFLHRDSDLAGQDFFDNRVMLRVGAHLNDKRYISGLPVGIGKNGSFFGGLQMGHGSTFTALDGPRGGGGGTVTADFGDHGGVTGLFAGYDHLFGKWFLGAEADIEVSNDFDWDHIESLGGRVFDVDRKESYGLAARLGYRQPNNVAYYGRTGIVSTNFDTNYSRGVEIGAEDSNQFGFRFGGGIEAPIAGSSHFLRMDYSYTTYDDYGVFIPSGIDTFDNSENILRVGYVFRNGIDAAEGNLQHDFSGPYIAAQAGYGGFGTRNRGPRNAGANLIVDRASHAATGGLFGGYGLMPYDNFYIGAEAEAELSYADWSLDRDPTGRVYDARKNWTIGASARAGYVFNDTVLVYGRFGGVRSEVETDYTRGAVSVNQKDKLSGIRYGGGLEVAAKEDLFVRMDYTYTNYEDYDVDYTTGIDTFNSSETMLRLGVGYRF